MSHKDSKKESGDSNSSDSDKKPIFTPEEFEVQELGEKPSETKDHKSNG